MPIIAEGGVSVRLILGRAYGAEAPPRLLSDAFYADVTLTAHARLPLPTDHEDRGIYVVEGSITVAGQEFDAQRMMVFRPGDAITVAAGAQGARLMLLGGATLNGPRYIWWNFVSSRLDRIEAAKEDYRRERWGEGMFDLPPRDREEFMPLPD